MAIPAIPPPGRDELNRMENRISFLYVERCIIDRSQNALTMRDERGVQHVPGAALGVLMLGPGTTVTHKARELLALNGATMVDVGQFGVRYYGHGRPLSSSTALLQAQARAWGNDRTRLRVARQMYRMRFADDDPSGLNMRQLRSAEGARVKKCYREHAARVGIPWVRRDYDKHDFEAGTPINQALSVGASCLYGLMHAIIVALGMSPGLGFIHTGYYPSFVHDIADLYKANTSIPIAFDTVASGSGDISTDVRRAMRDRFRSTALIAECVRDLQALVAPEVEPETPLVVADVTALWDEVVGEVPGGVDYSADVDDVEDRE